MRSKLFLVVLFCLCATGGFVRRGAAEDYRFTDVAEMKQTLPKYLKNPRSLYYIIMRANHIKISAELCKELHDLNKQNPVTPDLMSAYAFSQFMATNLYSPLWARGGQHTPLERELELQQMEANYCRDEAVKYEPNNPVILVEAGYAMLYIGTWNDGLRKKACGYLDKAVKLAPKWPEAHLDYAEALTLKLIEPKVDANAVAKQGILELQTAERLEPHLHNSCLFHYIYFYERLKQWDKLLSAIDAYEKIVPEAAKKKFLIAWRASAVKHLQEQKGQ